MLRLGRRDWLVIVALLVCIGLVDMFALARSYSEANADTVTVTAIGERAGDLTLDLPIIQQTTHIRFTGQEATAIARTLNTYSAPGSHSDQCMRSVYSDVHYAYSYTLTFWYRGILVETAKSESRSCAWTLSATGFAGLVWDPTGVLLAHFYTLTHGAFPTPDHPIYASPSAS